MMSHTAAPQTNAKRYWGEEKNIDSIYSIYVKKICYTYSNDVSIYTSGTNESDEKSPSTSSAIKRHSQTEKSRRSLVASNTDNSISTNDVTKLTKQEQSRTNLSRKDVETPRSRKNFFQKYRRRSCSMDKYSFEKAHKNSSVSSGPPTSNTKPSQYSKAMRLASLAGSSIKKNKIDNRASVNDSNIDFQDDINGIDRSVDDSNDIGSQNGSSRFCRDDRNRSTNSSSSKSTSANLFDTTPHKSMNDISMTQSTQAQSLLWETRQIKILQAATLDHVLKFILLINNSTVQNKQAPEQNNLNITGTNSSSSTSGDDSGLDEERNNVAHIIHVFFCTYRIYTNPYELMLKLMDYSDICRLEQYRFVMYYWMDNYPEDFDYIVESPENGEVQTNVSTLTSIIGANHNREPSHNSIGSASISQSINSYNNSTASYDSSATGRTNATTDSETNNLVAGADNHLAVDQMDGAAITTSVGLRNLDENHAEALVAEHSHQLSRKLSNLSLSPTTNSSSKDNQSSTNQTLGVPLVSELLRLCQDEHIRKRAIKFNEMRRGPLSTSGSLESTGSEIVGRSRYSSSGRHSHHHHHHMSSKNSAVLDLDSRYVAQQLTAIDLENFLNLRPYSLLEGSKSDKRIRCMIKNFNLLSRHVVITILKSHNPNIVTAHWIAIAMNLRKIKNFNSLKAIIAGLTNESIYRLKQLIWNKLDRISLANFNLLASIVDDVNNQIVLRQTQLISEGTAKMSIEDDSFGTIPYLGTFLTDLNMIDARHQSHVSSPKDDTSKLKLINFEKCAKQFEILTQVQLLQKNVLASLHAIQRRNNFDEQTTLNRLKLDQFNQTHQMLTAKPMIPKVARLFENWFFDENIAVMTDKQCYEISVNLEQNVAQR